MSVYTEFSAAIIFLTPLVAFIGWITDFFSIKKPTITSLCDECRRKLITEWLNIWKESVAIQKDYDLSTLDDRLCTLLERTERHKIITESLEQTRKASKLYYNILILEFVIGLVIFIALLFKVPLFINKYIEWWVHSLLILTLIVTILFTKWLIDRYDWLKIQTDSLISKIDL